MQQIYFSLSKDIQSDLHTLLGKGALWKVYPNYNKDLMIWELVLVKA